ncbi:hypothetical protein ACSS6W_005900 [Trichoderma asperelloides]
MASLARFHLAEWIHENSEHAKYNIAGSAAPSLTLRELISLSESPSETEAALKFDELPLGLGTNKGSLELRTKLAELYNEKIQPENFLTTPGATGANLIVFQSFLKPAWGMSGVRIGWIVCRDQDLTDLMSNTKQYIAQATSNIDEAIAAECLSLRCRPAILKRHLDYAQQNLELLEAFAKKNSDMCTWIRPTAGGTAFVKYHTISGDAIDDVQFCQELLKDYGVLLSPGSTCFGEETPASWQGYSRMHITVSPENMQKALEKISTLLGEKRKTAKYSKQS